MVTLVQFNRYRVFLIGFAFILGIAPYLVNLLRIGSITARCVLIVSRAKLAKLREVQIVFVISEQSLLARSGNIGPIRPSKQSNRQ